MVGFPFDDVNHWRGHFPPDVFAGQFKKMADLWNPGLAAFEKALVSQADPQYHARLQKDIGIAQACRLYFQSVANQTRFTTARNALNSDSLKHQDRQKHLDTIKAAASDELEIARQLFNLTRKDSRIGFEASSHYYYFPFDFVEKVLNCEYILYDWLPRQ